MFFGRKLKIRSSWKGTSKGSKRSETASEPVSPDHQRQLEKGPVQELGSREREELAVINKTLADDSFFQISLTSDTPNTSVLSGKINLIPFSTDILYLQLLSR